MTNPNLAGEYHNDIKNAATTTRTEILGIAKDKSLSRSERNRLITEKVDGFNSLTSKYLVGQKVEADFVKGIEKGNYSQEDPELNENANEISKYFAGEEGKTIERNETGYVFKNFKDGKDLVVNYNQLDNYIPKVKDEASLKTLNTDLNSEARKFEIKDAGAVSERLVQNYGEDQQRNLAANKYGINVKGMPANMVTEKLVTAIQEDFKGRVAEKVDVLGVNQSNRADDIAGVTRTLNEINKIRPQYTGAKFKIDNLPTGFRLEYVDYEDGSSKPIIARGTQKYQLEGSEKPEQLREILRGFYVDKIERYNIDVPQYTPPKPPIIN